MTFRRMPQIIRAAAIRSLTRPAAAPTLLTDRKPASGGQLSNARLANEFWSPSQGELRNDTGERVAEYVYRCTAGFEHCDQVVQEQVES